MQPTFDCQQNTICSVKQYIQARKILMNLIRMVYDILHVLAPMAIMLHISVHIYSKV